MNNHLSTQKLTSFRKRSRNDKIRFAIKFLLLAFLFFLQYRLPDILAWLKISGTIINAAVFYLTAHLIIDFSRIIIHHIYIRQKKISYVDNFLLGLNQISTLISFAFFVIAVLMALEVNVRELFTSLSIIAAALAILFKDYISNMVNGMIIMFSNQISLNDYVQIGEKKGKIVDINFMNIHLINDDEDLVYVPNNIVMNSDVLNYTKKQVNKISVEFEIDYQHLSKVEHLESYLKEALSGFHHLIKDNSYNLKTVDIRKDSATMKFQYILKEQNLENEKAIRRKTVRTIIDLIGEKNVKQA